MRDVIGFVNDDEDPLISFSEEEKGSLPDSDAALHILIAAARQCYRFLNPATSGIDEQTCWTHYVHSSGAIGFPKSDEIMPVIRPAVAECYAIWDPKKPMVRV